MYEVQVKDLRVAISCPCIEAFQRGQVPGLPNDSRRHLDGLELGSLVSGAAKACALEGMKWEHLDPEDCDYMQPDGLPKGVATLRAVRRRGVVHIWPAGATWHRDEVAWMGWTVQDPAGDQSLAAVRRGNEEVTVGADLCGRAAEQGTYWTIAFSADLRIL